MYELDQLRGIPVSLMSCTFDWQHTQASLQAWVVVIGIGTVIVVDLSLIHQQSWLDNLFRLAVSAGRGCWFCCNMCWYNWWGHGLQWDYNLILYGAVVITIGCQGFTDTLAIILGTIWYAGIVFLRFGWSAIWWAKWNFYINISCAVEIATLVIGEWDTQCDWLWTFGIHWRYSQLFSASWYYEKWPSYEITWFHEYQTHTLDMSYVL